MIKYYVPYKIKDANGVSNENSLFIKKDYQIGLAEPDVMCVQGKGYIVLDFKQETRGGIRILTASTEEGKNPKLRIRFGESLSEVYSNIEPDGATNDHSPRDFEVIISQWSDLVFGQTGFRFVRIDFLDDIKINIKSILAYSEETKIKQIYNYTGDDKEIKAIFNVAKRTIDLCTTKEYVWDGIKRDRLVWIGDMHPEMLALNALYGKCKQLENSFKLTAKQFPSNTFICGMPTYSLWFIIAAYDYYKKVNDKLFIEPFVEYIKGVLTNFNNLIDENGNFLFGCHFVDWPTVGKDDEIIGATIIAILAYTKGINLLKEYEIDTTSFENTLLKLRKVPLTIKTQKQVIGLKWYMNGFISDDEYNLLIKDGAAGFSTFMSYYILKAIASKNKDVAIKLMKEYYGAMLSLGATSFFEDFDIDWSKGACTIDNLPKDGEIDFHKTYGKFCYTSYRHSLCHGWSSGVIAFIKEECN